MKVESFLTLKDFFNYFVAGFIWLVDFYVLTLIVTDIIDVKISTSEFPENTNLIYNIVLGVIIIILPFLIGFLLNPIGEFTTEWIRKKGGDAIDWATNTEHPLHVIGLSAGELSRLNIFAARLFDIKNDPLSKWFYPVRAYILQKGGGAVELSNRALDLTNFSESILVPVPLGLLLTAVKLLLSKSYLCAVIALFFGYVAYKFIRRRYLFLRGYWVKHVYRAFLAIEAEKMTN